MSQEEVKIKTTINIYSSTIIGRMRKILYEKGPGFLIRKSSVFAWRFLYNILFLRFRKQRFFTYRNGKYPYFYHSYNFTWANERAVEIPIVMRILELFKDKKILEVGSVLSHYFSVDWDVLDKFEEGAGIICRDAVDFLPSCKYDLIISVSTLEHIGFDDDVRDPYKIIETVRNLKQNCLKPDGRMIFTMPLDYNPFMDDLLFNNKLGFDEISFMKRISRYEWCEVTKEELGDFSYATDYIEASAIVIAEFKSVG